MEKYIGVVKNFDIPCEPVSAVKWGCGHINDTLAVTLADGSRIILQRLNTSVFTKPHEVMENIIAVTRYLREKILERGGDPDRETLKVVLTKDGKPLYIDDGGGHWRVYTFITNSVSFERIEHNEDFYKCGQAFGDFAKMLVDFPAHELHETIPRFHDVPNRFSDFEEAVKNDAAGRVKNVSREIDLCMGFKKYAGELMDKLYSGELPLRVTHNDTKSNNVLFDADTHEPICVVDLDTVMPGLTAHDFANSIRYGANLVAEDDPDYEKAGLNMELYRLYTRGYLGACADVLTEEEICMLPVGARMMAIENAIRFLGDHLNGDTYFKTAYPEHNLVRARTQIALTEDMIKKWDDMNAVISEIAGVR